MIQMEYNTEHGIDPQTIRKKVTDILLSLGGGEARRRHAEAARRERSTHPRCPPRSWSG